MTSWVPFDLLDHLWQSTLFTAAVWLVAHAVRTNAARVRYRLWLAASLKFLVPVSLLVTIGERFAWRTTPAAPPPVVSFVIEQVLTPAAVTAATVPAAAATSSTLAWSLLIGAWACGVAFVLAQWWRQWQPIRRALRDARAIDIGQHAGLTVLTSPSMIEPGVFGIWRPVLLVPDGIRDRLTPAQLRALIAHEQCHVEHHDNLTATLHMAIEAVFWFHPLVWWLERRLIEERERACDEYVLQSGSTPRDYAEGILEVCRFAKEPAPVFVAGVTGSDLRRRIELILRNQSARPLGLERAVALLVCAAVAVLGPMTVGAVQSTKPAQAASGNRPRFEVSSIKLNTSGSLNRGTRGSPDGSLQATNMSVMDLITSAYGVRESEVSGGPGWLRSSLYDIAAKPAPGATAQQISQMIQSLLEDRFHLRVRRENRDMPIYSLRVAEGGLRFGPAKEGDCSTGPASSPREITRSCGYNMLSTATFDMLMAPIAKLAGALSALSGRRVVDETGLTGTYSLHLDFAPVQASDSSRPSIFTAVQEQLGLRLESTRGPVEVLVIDSAEKPTEN